MKKSKKTPSRIKYDKNHPTVSARLPVETKEKLHKNLAILGMTLPDAFKVLAGQLEVKAIPVEEARKAGYEEAKKLYMVPYACSVCGGLIPITSPKAKEAAGRCMTGLGWGHTDCHNKARQP
jgi:antitoxin component of RelBE/YafQ-DinJ toxin-antitoxin module